MSQVFLYRSTDANAPSNTATAGLLVALFQACLVDGYGSVAVSSVTRSGSTVTVTTGSAHGFDVRSTVQISGATEVDYNGKWKVASVPNSTSFTFDIGGATPTSPATGSIALKRAPAGWTMPFTGTNKAVFQPAVGGNQFCLRFDDNSPAGADARLAAVRAYESMTDVDTGTSPFPTVAQEANGLSFQKAPTLGQSRAWVLVASEHALYWIVDTYNINTGWSGSFFGDLIALEKPGDGYATGLIAGGVNTAWSGNNGAPHTQFRNLNGGNQNGAQGRHYLARAYDQTTKSVSFGKMGDLGLGIQGDQGFTYPAAIHGGLYMTPVRVFQGGYPRGVMPGLYTPLHTRPIANNTFVTGAGLLPGRNFLALYTDEGTGAGGETLLDVTGPW